MIIIMQSAMTIGQWPRVLKSQQCKMVQNVLLAPLTVNVNRK